MNLTIDKKAFNKNMYEIAYTDLSKFGFTITSYTLNHQDDDNGYFESLGKGRAAVVDAKARMGKAHHWMMTAIDHSNNEKLQKESEVSFHLYSF